MYKVYQQNICTNCLLMLVNGESDHTEKELENIGNFLFRYCQYLKFKGIDY